MFSQEDLEVLDEMASAIDEELEQWSRLLSTQPPQPDQYVDLSAKQDWEFE